MIGNSRVRGTPPPLCMTGVLCDSKSISIPSRGWLHYTIFRPRNLQLKPPLVCIAGGPLLASSYLNPIVHGVTDRSVVLYDAIGCGSSQPTPLSYAEASNIDGMVQDLSLILDQLPGYFFLLGHSFGGVLAYEYVKRNPCDDRAADGRGCKGLILVSTPVSLNDSRENSKRLMREIAEEIDALDDMQTVKSEFRKRHECRVTPLPLPLQSALMNSPMLSRQRMPNEYQATGGSRDSGSTSNLKLIVPVLVMRGEYDFCPEESCRKWCMLFDAAQSTYVTLAGCSHYSMLENDSMFASVVTSFLQDLDSNNKA